MEVNTNKLQDCDIIWVNAVLAGVGSDSSIIHNAAIAVKDGKIAWLGKMSDLPTAPQRMANEVHDVNGCCITPGLIDSHTHIVYAGNRLNEFEMRLCGKTYEEISHAGGGIQQTVMATRLALEEELFQASLSRVKQLQASGVTTIEIKSGYGLNRDDEIKMLKVCKQIAEALPISVKATYLGAHSIPVEYKGRADDYVNWICNEIIPDIAAEKLADAVDIFCEKIAFNLNHAETIFTTAKKYHLNVKCHAEQLSPLNSAGLAAKFNALSADHLEYLTPDGAKAMADAGTVAVLLPGAFYFLGEKKLPPIDLLREYDVPIAIATDSNPGSSPCLSLTLMMSMGCVLFKLTPAEVFRGVTINAAKALGISNTHGSLAVGKVADLAIWKIKHPDELAYYFGNNLLDKLVKNGKIALKNHLV